MDMSKDIRAQIESGGSPRGGGCPHCKAWLQSEATEEITALRAELAIVKKKREEDTATIKTIRAELAELYEANYGSGEGEG